MATIRGWEAIKEALPNLFSSNSFEEVADIPSQSVNDIRVVVGFQSYEVGWDRYYADYNTFRIDMSTGFKLKDETNPRYCAVMTGFNVVDNEPQIEVASGIITDGLNNLQLSFFDRECNIDCSQNNYMSGNSDRTSHKSRDELQSFIDNGLDSMGFEPTSFSPSGMSLVASIAEGRCIFADSVVANVNCIVFDNFDDAEDYIRTGNVDNAVYVPENKKINEPYKQWYIHTRIMKCKEDGSNKTQIADNAFYCWLPPSAKVAGYVRDRLPYNVHLVVGGVDSFKYSLAQHGERFEISTSSFNNGTANDKWLYDYGSMLTKNNVDFYYSLMYRNIPIFANQNDANLYLNDLIDDSSALAKATNAVNDKINKIGDRVLNNESDIFNGTRHEPLLTKQYYLSEGQLANMADLIYSSEPTTIEELIEGLAMHGNNPISDIIDCYAPGIDISDFVTMTSTSPIFFGSYMSDLGGWDRIITHGRVKEMGTVYLQPIHSDFRDFQNVRYTLYLPLCGTMELPPDLCIGKSLNIKAAVDTRSHNIRYYIFLDGMLYTYRDAAIGQNIVLMGNDTSGKARQNISGMAGIVTGVNNMAMGIVGMPHKMPTKGQEVVDMISGYAGTAQTGFGQIANGMLQIMQDSKRQYVGSQSAGLSYHDVMYPFLIIEVQDSIEPENLVNKYGKPANTITELKNCKGFTQCDDVQIRSSASTAMKDELRRLALSGIIL